MHGVITITSSYRRALIKFSCAKELNIPSMITKYNAWYNTAFFFFVVFFFAKIIISFDIKFQIKKQVANIKHRQNL